jgi:N-hydroxyarylamine O-acetyltransferase
VDVAAYLTRIGYSGSLAPTAETLRAIHRAHMYTVPFENLDIYGGRRRLEIDIDAFFRKVVGERRGGFCYELNGLFGALLRELGFHVQYLSGRVVSGTKAGPDFDHLLPLVTLDERWIADVGFGDSSRIPLRLDDLAPQGEPAGGYRLSHDGGDWSAWGLGANGKWAELYRFSLTPHALAEFAGMCLWHQTAPESPFMRNTLCTLPTQRGRITVSGNRLTIAEDGKRTIHRLPDEASRDAALWEHFGVRLQPVSPPA